MKYTQEQIQAMAKSALWHKVNSADAYKEFLMVLMLHTDIHPARLDCMISALAED